MRYSIKLKNLKYSGFSVCSKCEASYGWKSHNNSSHLVRSAIADKPPAATSGLFLFCDDCDKIVTVNERLEALDDWKLRSIKGMCEWKAGEDFEVLKEIVRILTTEFVEWPREGIEATNWEVIHEHYKTARGT